MSDEEINSRQHETEDDSFESQIRGSIGDDVTIHDTKDPDEIYVTNPSKMKLVLQDFKKAITAKMGIINPFMLSITIFSVLSVSSFSSVFGMSSDLVRSIFIVVFWLCILWLMYSGYNFSKYLGKSEPEYVVNELKSSK